MEQVLQNINKLNRSLEGIVAVRVTCIIRAVSDCEVGLIAAQVGGEFSSVEALWSHFEGVMGKTPETQTGQQETEVEGEDETVVGSKERS